MRAILFVHPKKSCAQKLKNEISAELAAMDICTDLFTFNEKSVSPEAGYDIAISLGGDGTVLSAARVMSPLGIPVFPVNLGTFGFIAGVQPLQWREAFDAWLRGKASFSRRMMLEIKVKRGTSETFSGCCLNDVTVSSSVIARIINLSVFSGKNGPDPPLKLISYRSDGLIISTPTGSTAYSAAAGGPIVDPELEAFILNPICPFTLTHRPMILPADEIVTVEVDKNQRNGVLLTLDGQVTHKLKSGDRISIEKAAFSCLLAASGRSSFYQALRTKLSWAGEGESKPVNSVIQAGGRGRNA